MQKAIAASALYSTLRKNLTALFYLLTGEHRRFERIEDFESRFAESEGSAHAVATSLARVALYHVLTALELKSGDPILLTPVNIPEMLSVIRILELKPVFVDFAPNSLFPDAVDLKKKAACGARAFFLTYIAGQIGDLAAVKNVCETSGIVLIQDCTQANRCSYRGRPLTSWGEYSIFSTCELKFVHTFRGAVICLNSGIRLSALKSRIGKIMAPQRTGYLFRKWIVDTLASIALQPRLFALFFHRLQNRILSQDPLRRAEETGVRCFGMTFFGSDVKKMRSTIPGEMLFRASNFEARLGLAAVDGAGELISRHQAIAQLYTKGLSGYGVLPSASGLAVSSFWRFPIILRDAEEASRFMTFMRRQRIAAEKSGLTLLSVDQPIAKDIIAKTVFLPCHAGIDPADSERVLRVAGEFLAQREGL